MAQGKFIFRQTDNIASGFNTRTLYRSWRLWIESCDQLLSRDWWNEFKSHRAQPLSSKHTFPHWNSTTTPFTTVLIRDFRHWHNRCFLEYYKHKYGVNINVTTFVNIFLCQPLVCYGVNILSGMEQLAKQICSEIYK